MCCCKGFSVYKGKSKMKNLHAVNSILSPSLFFFSSFFWLFRTAPEAYGGSQDKGQIGAVATTPQPQQRQILKPLSKGRDRTCVLMDASQICFH